MSTIKPRKYNENLSDEENVLEDEKAARIRRDRDLDDIRTVCKSRQGRRVLWTLLSYCNVFDDGWRMSAEIHKLAGMRNVGIHIMQEICAADQEIFFQMMKEAKEDKETLDV